MTEPFDFDKALKAIQSGQAISGKDGVLAPLLKQLTEAALEAELESHIADDVAPVFIPPDLNQAPQQFRSQAMALEAITHQQGKFRCVRVRDFDEAPDGQNFGEARGGIAVFLVSISSSSSESVDMTWGIFVS